MHRDKDSDWYDDSLAAAHDWAENQQALKDAADDAWVQNRTKARQHFNEETGYDGLLARLDSYDTLRDDTDTVFSALQDAVELLEEPVIVPDLASGRNILVDKLVKGVAYDGPTYVALSHAATTDEECIGMRFPDSRVYLGHIASRSMINRSYYLNAVEYPVRGLATRTISVLGQRAINKRAFRSFRGFEEGSRRNVRQLMAVHGAIAGEDRSLPDTEAAVTTLRTFITSADEA